MLDVRSALAEALKGVDPLRASLPEKVGTEKRDPDRVVRFQVSGAEVGSPHR